VVSDSLLYAGAATLQRLLPFAALPVLSRIVDSPTLGRIGVALALASALSIVMTLGWNFALTRLYYDEDETSARAGWVAVLQLQFCFAVVLAVVIGLSGGPVLSSLLGDGSLAWPVAVYAAAQSVLACGQAVLRARLLARIFLLSAVVQLGIGLALGIALAVRFGASGYLWGLAAGAAAGAACAGVVVRRKPRWSRQVIGASLLLGLPFLLHAGAVWALSLSDRVIVAHSLGPVAAAQYYVSYSVGVAGLLLFDAVQSAWAPRYFRDRATDKAAKMESLVVPLTGGAAGLTLLVIGLVPLGLAVVGGTTDVDEAVRIATIVAVVLVLRPLYLLAATRSLDLKRASPVAWASGTAACVGIALNLVLVPVYGLEAAAVVTVVAYAVQAVCLYLVLVARGEAFRVPSATWWIVVATTIGAGIIACFSSGTASVVVRCLALAIAAGILLRTVPALRRLSQNEVSE
jgi:O-antigen/teichoic acid export membrane protein